MRFRSEAAALLLSLGLAFSAAPAFAQAPQEAAAQVRFGKGRDLFMDKKYAEALVEFRSASELFASPNTRLYIARCERELGHPGRAYVEFQRAASEASDRARIDPKYASTRDTARQEAQALEGKFGKLTVKAKDAQGANITVGGAPLGAAALGVATPMDPGNVEIAATAKGKLPFKKQIAIKAGENAEITIVLDPDPNAVTPDNPPPDTTNTGPTGPTVSETSNPPPDSTMEVEHRGGGVRVAGIFVIGAGVAGFVGFAVFASVAQSQFDQLKTLKEKCTTNCPTPEVVKSKVDEGTRNQTIANVGLGIGIGAFIVGGIMFAAGGPTTVTRTKQGRLVPILTGGPNGAFAGVEGAF
jgi:hypothetical protein